MGKGRVPASREYTLVDQAVNIYHKTGSEQEWQKFVNEACGGNLHLATDIYKQVDKRILYEDMYDL